ncbi:hypothetical protein ACROYT_G005648 [Oculina patagonica]
MPVSSSHSAPLSRILEERFCQKEGRKTKEAQGREETKKDSRKENYLEHTANGDDNEEAGPGLDLHMCPKGVFKTRNGEMAK